MRHWLVGLAALCLATLAIFQLEQGRQGLTETPLMVGQTPATVWQKADADPAPVVIIAHGFAGSRQLMHGFSQTLAHAGYIAVAYDLEGHGRNPVPMSGGVNSIDGTTRLLVEELDRVIGAALALPEADGRVAVLGHSMASDIIVRQAIADPRVAATVAVSMFSEAVTADAPKNLLIINGAWEGALAREAARVIALTEPGATFGDTIGSPADGTGRRAVLAPNVEHVGVLHSGKTIAEAVAWLDTTFARKSEQAVVLRGGWIILLILSVTALAWPLAKLAKPWRAETPPIRLDARQFWAATLIPMIATPLILWPIEIGFLPVLVADYLAVHFALYGTLGLIFLIRARAFRWDGRALLLALPIALFCIVIFGGMLDRYVASFLGIEARLNVILAIALGAIPFMLADAYLTEGGRAPLWRVVWVRASALISLGLATALDFEGLFFLILILPIILLFFLLFGTLAGWVGRATQRPMAAGVGLGVFLGWALGMTFPLFAV